MSFINFLNQNSGAFSVLFSFLVTFATLAYAILTWRLVSETKKMRKVQTEPKISIFMQPKEESINIIDLIIQNIGLGPAYNLEFKIDPDFEYLKGEFLSERGFLKRGIGYLAPSEKIICFLTLLSFNYKEKIKTSIRINVNYKNAIGINYHDTFEIDFSELSGLERIGTPPLHKIAENISKIQNDLGRICSGFNRIKVIAYTKEDEKQEFAETISGSLHRDEELK